MSVSIWFAWASSKACVAKLLGFSAFALFQRDATELKKNSYLLVQAVDDLRHLPRLFQLDTRFFGFARDVVQQYAALKSDFGAAFDIPE